MTFEIPKQPYSGKIGETTLGQGGGAVVLGGEDSYPFHLFEGKMPNAPKIAMEVWDYDPTEEWPAAAVEPFKDVISSPDAWAKKCVDVFGADAIVVQLKSTDPNGMDRSADEAADVAKKVSDAVDVPLIFWGTANNQKDEEVLKKIAEMCEKKNVALGPVEEGNHKGVGASALGYGHCIVSSSPIDVNLAKQLNILLGNLGVQSDKIIIDPTTGGLGYGMEYSYSVMERISMAALTQEDDKLQIPMINNIGNEVWKCKEAGLGLEEAPTLGDPEKRAILMESVAAVCYLMAGSDMPILRHPESVRLTRSFIDLLTHGGSAKDVQEISKNLEGREADLLSLSPAPNLDFGEPEAEPKPKAAPKPEKKKEKPAPPKAEEKVVEMKPKEAPKAEAEEKIEAKAEAEEKVKAEEEAKAKVEAEAKAEAEAKIKTEEEAKAKAEADAKARAEEDAKAKAEGKAKEKEALQALRYKRAQEKEKHLAQMAGKKKALKKTVAKEQLDMVDRLIHNIDRIHKRL
ncbi:MAG: acetyl-CoA decarbonylase/synthase complex subunit delta [Deltaproteobacteria bacterium]|nr:acetyl-CoA decarbonylase/synthase complex subunit delta [Deltaproteobacteria bacterium]